MALLFELSGSGVGEVTLAVFTAKLLVLTVLAVTLMVIETTCPLVKSPRLQVTVALACEHVPTLVEAD